MSKKVSIKTLLRTDDAFLTTSEKLYNYWLTHAGLIIGAAAGVVAAALIVAGVLQWRGSKAQAGQEAYLRALTGTEVASVVDGLKQVRSEYAGDPAARQASFALVNAYLSENKVEEALPLLEELVGALKPAEEGLRPLALSALGGLYEEKKELDKALSHYQAALASALGSVQSTEASPYADAFLSELYASVGRAALGLGRIDEAKKAYEDLMSRTPETFRAYIAQIKLSQLSRSAGSPKEIQPAASEPAAPVTAVAASPSPEAAAPSEGDAAEGVEAPADDEAAAAPVAVPADEAGGQ
ncbi:MAG: tetratricopeptide repeat protein [Deltaproteobacteria bacterium]|nr:tetratricopeptide repeat protein [Deltaproteobacteria bacterium]